MLTSALSCASRPMQHGACMVGNHGMVITKPCTSPVNGLRSILARNANAVVVTDIFRLSASTATIRFVTDTTGRSVSSCFLNIRIAGYSCAEPMTIRLIFEFQLKHSTSRVYTFSCAILSISDNYCDVKSRSSFDT